MALKFFFGPLWGGWKVEIIPQKHIFPDYRRHKPNFKNRFSLASGYLSLVCYYHKTYWKIIAIWPQFASRTFSPSVDSHTPEWLRSLSVRMAERSKALRSGRSPLLWAWVRIPLLAIFFSRFPIIQSFVTFLLCSLCHHIEIKLQYTFLRCVLVNRHVNPIYFVIL